MRQVFGLKSEALAQRFYYFLSRGFDLKRIYVTDYVQRLWGLACGSFIEKNYFAFCLLDWDNDGLIGASDLVHVQKEILLPFCHSEPHQTQMWK
jgi:hypothetical protein